MKRSKVLVLLDVLLTFVVFIFFFSSCRRILGVDIDESNYYIGYSSSPEYFLSVLELLLILFLGFVKIIFLVKKESVRNLNIVGLSIILLSFPFLWFNILGIVLLIFLCKKIL
jgi:hypothetical protein